MRHLGVAQRAPGGGEERGKEVVQLLARGCGRRVGDEVGIGYVGVLG